MDGMNKILQRISNIEQRFGITAQATVSTTSFAGALANVEKSESGKAVNSEAATAQRRNSSTQSTADIAELIDKTAKRYGVDPKLALAVARTESNLSPDAVSSAGAVGVMQLMPETASSLGVRDITNPSENIDAGVRYLRQMLDTFDGNATYAVAAYNAGPQAVKDYQGIPPYAETRNYVKKVLSTWG